MVKKLLTIMMGLIVATGLMAQSAPKSVTISEANVQFWTGTGSNSTVVAIGWDDEDASYTPTVVVWGVRWNGTITLLNALDTIMAYDSRFSYTISGSFLTGLNYVDPSNGVALTPSMGWNCNSYGGVYNSTNLSNGTWLRISESTCDNYNFTGVNNLIYASNPSGGATLPDTVDASLPFSEILYWVGTGSDSAEFIVNFANPDTAFAWGYLFNGTTTAQAMVDAIAAADPRFWTEGSPSLSGDIHFVTDNGDTLGLSPVDPTMGYNFWWTNLNGVSAGSGAASTLHNGDVFKYGDMNSATGWDALGSYYMEEAWNTIPTPVSVPTSGNTPTEATIAFSDILYWVGEGTNEAVLAVNWADTALAWGYRWNGTATVAGMMDAIAAVDPRFDYSGTGFLSDITFNDGTVSLAGTPGNYWGSTNNGVMDMGLGQTLANGDFEKWADPAAGVIVDSTYDNTYNYWWYTYAYPMTIHAVTQPLGAGPFCGIVGTEGCTAIAANSSDILGWATACTLDLGPQNISVEGSPLVSYHTAEDAIGPCTMNDNLSVVSLGDGGSATLTFAHAIKNGNGPDFAVFENSFDDYFLELAFVEVSSDGERFVRFPATSLTQTVRQIGGSGRVDASYINNLAGKYRSGYGTPFDLAELADSTGIDINNITHVRIVDAIGSIDPQYASYDAFGHMVNDPWPTNSYSSGFDLDGVAVLHEATTGIADVDASRINLWPNPATNRLTISGAEGEDAVLFDMMGCTVKAFTIAQADHVLDISALPCGIYMLRIGGEAYRIVKQ